MVELEIVCITAKPYRNYRNFHFNEFVANVFRDNIGSKQIQFLSSKQNWGPFLVLNVKKITWRSVNFLLLIYFKVVSKFPKQISFSIRFRLRPQTRKTCPVASKLYQRLLYIVVLCCGCATSPVLEQDQRSWILVLEYTQYIQK
jgi:hypothetical protein